MKTMRLFCLAGALAACGVSGLSAQLPKVGQPVQIKPGGDGGKPAVNPGADPKKNANPNPNPNPNQPGVPGGVGNPQFPPNIPGSGIPPVMPAQKQKEPEYPKEIGDKTLEMWIKELRTSKDAAARENAIRVLPGFGPDGVIKSSEVLLNVLKSDPDMNVRLTALSITPFMIYDQRYDPMSNDRLEYVIRLLGHDSLPVRFDATSVIVGIGPVAKKAVPQLLVRSVEPSSWQIRKAAASALGSVGRGFVNPNNPADRIDPVEPAVLGLLKQLQVDSSLAVRREAANSLILVGPVSAAQQKLWRTTLDNVLKSEKDRGIAGLVRVAIIKNDPAGVKGNEQLVSAITTQLLAPEPAARSEACQALGMLGEPVSKTAQDLLDIVTNPKEDNSVVAAAIMAVATMKSRAALTTPVLKKVSESHKNDEVKAFAKEAVRVLEARDMNPVPPPVVPPKVGAPGKK